MKKIATLHVYEDDHAGSSFQEHDPSNFRIVVSQQDAIAMRHFNKPTALAHELGHFVNRLYGHPTHLKTPRQLPKADVIRAEERAWDTAKEIHPEINPIQREEALHSYRKNLPEDWNARDFPPDIARVLAAFSRG